MGLKFNPLSGNLDLVDSPNGVFQSLEVDGDITLDDGIAGPVTTLQTITPTANRTVSIPDATGTLGLVAGSSGQLVYNNAGAYAGVSTMTFDGTSVTLAGRLINSYTSVASSPAKVFTGTWFTGGTATTTKPHFLIEPSGTTSTAWSTSGTGLGVNAASGFAGNLLDLQVNGTSQLSVSSNGTTTMRGPATLYSTSVNRNLWRLSALGTSNGLLFEYNDGANWLTRLNITSNGDFTLRDSANFEVGTTTGTKIGTSTSQKLGFFNKTPVAQPAAVADATDAATAITQLNALLSRMRDLGLIAT